MERCIKPSLTNLDRGHLAKLVKLVGLVTVVVLVGREFALQVEDLLLLVLVLGLSDYSEATESKCVRKQELKDSVDRMNE
jgi:hypothetical protein